MAKKSYLNSIDVPKPCNAAWNKMIGDDEKRFCLSCKKDVYNLSAMPRRKARKLVANNAGKICVRYARLPNGKLLTINDKPLHQITRRTSTIAAGVIATTISLSAASYAQGEAITHKQDTKQKEVAEQNKDKKPKNEIGTSQISFTVKDGIDAPIPEAEVKLTADKSKQEFIVLTDDKGIAQFSSLPKGRYKLDIYSPHFTKESRYIRINQPIEPNLKINLDIPALFIGIVTISEKYEIPFFDTIMQEDIKSLEDSISLGFDVNTKDQKGITALHVAVESGNLDILKLLLQNSAEINAKDKQGKTPLMMLEDEPPIEIINLLIQKGADVNATDKKGRTPLMYLALEDIENVEVIKTLVKSGANINAKDKGKNTVLIYFCNSYSEEIVEELLKAGANPNVKNKDGETPLSLAGTNQEMVEILRRYGAIK